MAPRKKSAKKKRPSENEIHIKCFQWVSNAYPKLLIFHVANERQAAVQYHVKLKRLGVLKGTPDFLAFPNGRKVAIELKDDEGVQDKDQQRFQKRWERAGGVYLLIRTLEDFRTATDALMMFG